MTLKERGFYHWSVWRRLRKVALDRDHYFCQECLRQGKHVVATEVHHKKPVEDYPELALCLDNLECLCWQCHEDTKTRETKKTKPHEGVRIIKIT